MINKKKNVFFTGSAGTGKSVLLKELAKKLKEIYGEAFGLTASTGLAACNIGGMTLHGYLSIGIGNQSVEAMAKKIIKNTRSDYKWNTMKVLIIDEVSMIDGLLLDKINIIARMVRKTTNLLVEFKLSFVGIFINYHLLQKMENICLHLNLKHGRSCHCATLSYCKSSVKKEILY